MRILFASNLFPPVTRGGYEQWCEEVALALHKRGHTLAVLTAQAGGPVAADAGQPFAVHRLLHPEVEGGMVQTTLDLLRNDPTGKEQNVEHTEALLAAFRPDAVLIWGMWNISRAVPQAIERLMGERVAYYLSDYWPALPDARIQRLQEPARHAPMQALKSLLGRYYLPRLTTDEPLRLANPICVSRAVRDILLARGVDVSHAAIVPGGTDIAEFEAVYRQSLARAATQATAGSLRLLYLGRLERIKGVHTLVRAMSLLPAAAEVTLDIVGAGDADYAAELRGMVDEHQLAARVRFCGAVPRQQAPAVLGEHDVLVFPSEWEEPFGRSLVEAMAAGLAVISTRTGGAADIVIDSETGLAYAAGNAEQLAGQIRRLLSDPPLCRRLREAGREHVRRHFTLDRMVQDLEGALCAVASKLTSTPVREV